MKLRQLVLALLFSGSAYAQTAVVTQDVTHFFEAFDQVMRTLDEAEQLNLVQRLYVDKASSGLKDFMALGGGTTSRWLNYMRYNQAYLNEMRSYMTGVEKQATVIQETLDRIKTDYPGFKEGTIYFLVGCGFVGGTPNKQTNNLLIGTEVAVKKNADWAVPLAVHEFIHIQQKEGNGQLLTQTLNEGVAEFLSEVYFGKNLAANGYAPHILVGQKNNKELWERYKADMFQLDNGFSGWLYGIKLVEDEEIQDLGYFMGYAICRSFYEHSTDKQAAIRALLALDLSSNEAAREFVLASGFVPRKDLSFVKETPFSAKQAISAVPKSKVGYRVEADEVLFEYTGPSDFLNRFKIQVEVVNVAGSFNAWNPGDTGYSMKKVEANTFELRVPKTKLGLPEKQQFKFVLNKDIWMPTPEYAENKDPQSQNLVLE